MRYLGIIFLLAHLAALGQCCISLDDLPDIIVPLGRRNAEELSIETRPYDEGAWEDNDGFKDDWEAPDSRWN